MSSEVGKCALCHGTRPLRESHIIPEFLYKSMYDDKHRFRMLSVRSDIQHRTLQKGFREELLCLECEGILSTWENYAMRVLNGGVPLSFNRFGTRVDISGIDYAQFKLFQLSILWRSSISKSKVFFEKVNLGPHEETIRKMLIQSDPGSAASYGCLMYGLKGDEDSFQDLIVQPSCQRVEGHRCFRFVFGGFGWIYFVSRHNPPFWITKHFVQETGHIYLTVTDLYAAPWMKDFAVELQKMN